MTKIAAKIGDDQTFEKSERIRLVIDTGLAYSIIPGEILRRHHVVPVEEEEFILATGKRITRSIGFAWMEILGKRFSAPVIFGERQDKKILGVLAMQIGNFVFDAREEQLKRKMAFICYACGKRMP